MLGEDPTAPERLYDKLFSLTETRTASEKKRNREAIIRVSSALDLACWDIIGKMANLPLSKLFGGWREKVQCYVTCAYYRDVKDNAELRDEIEGLVAAGHQGFMAKIGG